MLLDQTLTIEDMRLIEEQWKLLGFNCVTDDDDEVLEV